MSGIPLAGRCDVGHRGRVAGGYRTGEGEASECEIAHKGGIWLAIRGGCRTVGVVRRMVRPDRWFIMGYSDAIKAVFTVADIQDSVAWSWDENDIAFTDDDVDCENPF